MKWFLTLCAAVVLTGCATPNSIRLTDTKDGATVREVSIDPVMLAGLPWTEDLRRGTFVAVMGNFPQTPQSYAEWDPLRIRYQAHAVGVDGTEYVANALFAGYIGCFPRYFVFVEGLKSSQVDVKVITLSTLVDRAYTLKGDEIGGFEAGKFQTDAAYRKAFVRREGTPLGSVRSIDRMERAFEQWSVYKTSAGLIATPIDEAQMKRLAGINPQYSYWEKVVGTARGSISLDYVGTVIGVVFDLINAGQAKAKGFDYESSQSRLQQGYNQVVMEALRAKGERSCMAALATTERR